MPNSVRKLIKNGIEYGGIFVQGGSPAVTVVDVPDAHGGIEKRITAVDISDTTAQAADVAQGRIFYTANGTRTTGTGSGGGDEPVLPPGYTRYKYLESSGTQYIDTGLYTKDGHEYYITYLCAAGTVNVFGNNLSTGCGAYIQSSAQDSAYWRFGSANYIVTRTHLNPLFVRELLLSKSGLYAYDRFLGEYHQMTALSSTTVTEDTSIHNILFGRTTGENARQLGASKIYHFKCTENGVAVRDMYPAMRNLDGVLGMYDIVNDVFYTNAGTGTFTGGIAA